MSVLFNYRFLLNESSHETMHEFMSYLFAHFVEVDLSSKNANSVLSELIAF